MWHVVTTGYLLVAVIYSTVQPGIARALIYLVFWAVLPSLLTVFAVRIHRHDKRMRQEEAVPPPPVADK